MKELVLALAIHDKDVTMVKPARVTFTRRTGLTPPPEKCKGTKTHRNNELGFPTLSKQRSIIAAPSYMRRPSPIKVQVRGSRHFPSAHQGFIRGAIALHNLSSSGQHRSPDCGPTAVPRPYNEQEYEERGETGQAVRNDPFSTQLANAANAENALLPRKAPRNNHTPDLAVFSIHDPSHSELLCPAQVTRKKGG